MSAATQRLDQWHGYARREGPRAAPDMRAEASSDARRCILEVHVDARLSMKRCVMRKQWVAQVPLDPTTGPKPCEHSYGIFGGTGSVASGAWPR